LSVIEEAIRATDVDQMIKARVIHFGANQICPFTCIDEMNLGILVSDRGIIS
jgi:hypothetical protein